MYRHVFQETDDDDDEKIWIMREHYSRTPSGIFYYIIVIGVKLTPWSIMTPQWLYRENRMQWIDLVSREDIAGLRIDLNTGLMRYQDPQPECDQTPL